MDVTDYILSGICEGCDQDVTKCFNQGYCEYDEECPRTISEEQPCCKGEQMIENPLVNTCEREPEIAHYCEICGNRIYEGEEYYNVGGTIICEDCMRDFKKVATIE